MQLTRQHGKLIIVATQMLASMVDKPEPTRAEASDVALAVMQGADTVMLSDETANGNYPLETVAAMKKIILYTQNNTLLHDYPIDISQHDYLDSIGRAAVKLADEVQAQAIVVETKTGATASRVASARPNRVIVSVTDEPRTAQQLALSYANQSYIRAKAVDSGYKLAKELKRAKRFAEDRPVKVVIVSGRQPGVTGGTDTIQVRSLGGDN